jgi:FkbM family methyltransferase
MIRKLLKQEAVTAPTDGHEFHRTFQRLAQWREMGFQPGYVVDVGASDGRWSKRGLKVFPWAQFFCVEPLDENQTKLERCCEQFSNITRWQGCLGATRGTAVLNADGDGSSILRGHTDNAYGDQREVMVETLDDLIDSEVCRQPDLIKLDVQGYELAVLEGAAKALSKTEAVIAEVSFVSFQTGMPVFHEVVDFMAQHGFVVADILSMTTRPLDGATAQADVLFIREDHELRFNNQWDHDSVY